ncbi:MAG: DUF4493 domain-containing protein [Rikenellaceae bacterium]
MKKLFIMILAISLWSCSTKDDVLSPIPEGKGGLRSSFVSQDIPNDIVITILKGENVIETWSSVAEIPAVITIDAGDYTMMVKSKGDMMPVSDKPYYNATKNFTIVKGEVTFLSLECTMLNMKVSVEVSEALKTTFPMWQAEFFFLDNMEVVFYTMTSENNKPIYITPASFGVTLKDAATSASRTVLFENYSAAMYHNVKFE